MRGMGLAAGPREYPGRGAGQRNRARHDMHRDQSLWTGLYDCLP
jgi:hypothetical protein